MDLTSKPILGEEINKETESLYKKEKKLGEGTYAVVYLGHHVKTKRMVAIKKIKLGNARSGLDMSAIREVKALRELRHPNVIELIDVFSHKANLNLVLEYLEMDLEAVIKDKSLLFMPADIKSWLMMALRGLDHCHKCWLLHRDLKPNNFLIASDGQLKLADFGLAREFGDVRRVMTSQTVTRWYRAPELLLGATNYTGAVDMWAMGCVFAELLLRTPYLAGDSDLDQLSKIFRARGTPTEEEWAGMDKLPMVFEFEQHPRPQFSELFRAASDDALNLMNQMLLFNPAGRISASDALNHPYFLSLPRPTDPARLPRTTPIGGDQADASAKKRPYQDAFVESSSTMATRDPEQAFKKADLRIKSPA
ncbi:TFIIH complex serine/threonine-protein kinase subunit kin28 [Coemansia sp. RSA 552]|nr:TFIIH complex serine/threonine-protein kinase subunit kin28 [Coemansia sp. RSA 552]